MFYGYYITDAGDSVFGRFEIHVHQTPWQIALAPLGRRVLAFEHEAVSNDTFQVQFEWPGRAHAQCRLQRNTHDSWLGQCLSRTGSSRAVGIGGTGPPDQGQGLSPTAADLAILERAARFLASEAAWNRSDERIWDDDAETGSWSLFCALYQASLDETGHYLHRRPVMEAVRRAIFESARDRVFAHQLRDYNNHPRTSFTELHQLLQRARASLEAQLTQRR